MDVILLNSLSKKKKKSLKIFYFACFSLKTVFVIIEENLTKIELKQTRVHNHKEEPESRKENRRTERENNGNGFRIFL